MAGLKLNIWTIAGGLVLIGGGYLLAKHMKWLPPEWQIVGSGGSPTWTSGVPGYTENGYDGGGGSGYSTGYGSDGNEYGYGGQSSDFGLLVSN